MPVKIMVAAALLGAAAVTYWYYSTERMLVRGLKTVGR